MWSSFKTINHLVHKRIPYKIHSLQTHCMMRVLEKLVYNRYIIFINHTPTHTYFLCLYSICEYMIFKKEKIQTTQFFLVKSKLSTTKKCKTATFSRIFFTNKKLPNFSREIKVVNLGINVYIIEQIAKCILHQNRSKMTKTV